ncbi:hypothetical protein AWM79_04785 [Pseudomonas agarici]|uniref:Uncharacterized protein n=1 Tax=Pseudomonas agarici TaxID=46677 RepID=A0A0X1SXS5_PSEAA|nr:hypothetical protein [Pseudomonas agarici]AMB84656.1 hypothetical protein AWM79_04785 [Pseudomonas agarici]SEL06596.1 hypothetical protein SAMN05216604_11089 [Pseudomonas agarici]
MRKNTARCDTPTGRPLCTGSYTCAYQTPLRAVLLVGATLGTFALLSIDSRAQAAGGSYIVDDGSLNDPGECNIDTWYKSSRHNASSGETALSQDCTPNSLPSLQFGADINRSRDDGQHQTLLSPHLKVSLLSRADLGLEAALSTALHFATARRHSLDGVELSVPLTYQPIDPLHLTVSGGWAQAYDDGRQHRALTWGTGVEYDVAHALTLVAERFGRQHGDQGWQTGPRLHIGEKLDIDLVVGHYLNGNRDRWLTTGATLRF